MTRGSFELDIPRIPLRAAVAAAIAVRLFWIVIAAWRVGTEAFLVPDSWAYLEFAFILATRGEFANSFGTPEIFRTPGYPLLLSPAYFILRPFHVALVLNLILTAAIVATVFAIARRLFDSERIAGLCALVVALEPTMLIWSLRVMPETLLALCLLVFAWAALRAIDLPRRRWVVTAAAALSAAAYVKPVIWPFVVLVCAAVLLRPTLVFGTSRGTTGPPIRHALIFVLVCAPLIVPWHVRNYVRAGHAGFSTVMTRAAYIAAAGSVIARRDGRPYADVQKELIRRAEARTDHTGQLREGLSVVATDPLGYATTQVRGTMRTLFDPGAMEYLRLLGLYSRGGRAVLRTEGIVAVARAYPLGVALSAATAVLLLPLIVLPLIAAIRLPRNKRPAFIVLALIAGYLALSGGGQAGTSRFRAPAVPFLVLMSAFVITPRAVR